MSNTFNFKTPNIADKLSTSIKKYYADQQASIFKKVSLCVTVVHKTATIRRPKISITAHKALGRATKVNGKSAYRVSDPNAEAGVPVDTGTLQGSIQKEVTKSGSKIVGRVWTEGIPYAAYIEFGTSKAQARPFMRPALALNKEFIKSTFDKKS